jgi:hypothetical protein
MPLTGTKKIMKNYCLYYILVFAIKFDNLGKDGKSFDFQQSINDKT